MNKPSRVFPVIVLASLLVEIIQYLAAVGSSDIDDIILNFSGGILGFLIFKFVQRKAEV